MSRNHKLDLLKELAEREKDGIKLNRHDRRLKSKLSRTVKLPETTVTTLIVGESLPVS